MTKGLLKFMRKLALDVGDATIGVAVSDQLGIIAQGLTTIERVGIRKDAGKVIDLIREYDCDTVILGLPKNMDGSEGPRSQASRSCPMPSASSAAFSSRSSVDQRNAMPFCWRALQVRIWRRVSQFCEASMRAADHCGRGAMCMPFSAPCSA